MLNPAAVARQLCQLPQYSPSPPLTATRLPHTRRVVARHLPQHYTPSQQTEQLAEEKSRQNIPRTVRVNQIKHVVSDVSIVTDSMRSQRGGTHQKRANELNRKLPITSSVQLQRHEPGRPSSTVPFVCGLS